MPRAGIPAALMQTEADGNGVVHLRHDRLVQMSHLLPQTAFIQCTDLFQQDDRVLGKPDTVGINIDVRGQAGLAHPGGNGGGNNRRAVAVADVVLDDQHRAQTSLLGTDNRAEISVEYIAPAHRGRRTAAGAVIGRAVVMFGIVGCS